MGNTYQNSVRKEPMSTLKNTLPVSSNASTKPVESSKQPTIKRSDAPRNGSIDRWLKKVVDRFNDQKTPFPKVW